MNRARQPRDPLLGHNARACGHSALRCPSSNRSVHCAGFSSAVLTASGHASMSSLHRSTTTTLTPAADGPLRQKQAVVEAFISFALPFLRHGLDEFLHPICGCFRKDSRCPRHLSGGLVKNGVLDRALSEHPALTSRATLINKNHTCTSSSLEKLRDDATAAGVELVWTTLAQVQGPFAVHGLACSLQSFLGPVHPYPPELLEAGLSSIERNTMQDLDDDGRLSQPLHWCVVFASSFQDRLSGPHFAIVRRDRWS